MTEVSEKNKQNGYILSVVGIILAIVAMFAPIPAIVCLVIVVIGLICSIFAIMKGDTGGKIIGVISLLINLGMLFLGLLALSL